MPRIGKITVIGLLWGVLGACLICTGCTADRDMILAESEAPTWDSVPPSSPTVTPAAMTSGPMGAQTTTPPQPAVLPAPTAPTAPTAPLALPVPPPLGGVAGIPDPVGVPMPRELDKVSHPTYVIQPPDVLLIDAARLVPLPPYRVEPLDSLAIMVPEPQTLPKQPIQGVYQVDASGTVNLGFTYGAVMLMGQTIEEAKKSIENHLKAKLKPPYEVYVAVAETKILQQIRGEHIVRQDGTIGLGTYGSVYVTGLTIAQAKAAIEKHLEQYLFRPRLSVDIAGFNSHMYYVIYDFPGTGQMVFRLPITGNETVIDALGTLRFLPMGVSKRRIWVARPAPAKCAKTQILPVDWQAITRNGSTATNYQLLPGDRVFVAPDPCSNLDAQLARLFSPIERVFGIILLGNSTIQNFRLGAATGFGGGVR